MWIVSLVCPARKTKTKDGLDGSARGEDKSSGPGCGAMAGMAGWQMATACTMADPVHLDFCGAFFDNQDSDSKILLVVVSPE